MGVGIERSLLSNDVLTFVYIFIFLMLAFLKFRFPKKFLALTTCFFSKSFFVDYANELTTTFSVFKSILFLVQNLILSIFIFNLLSIQVPEIYGSIDPVFIKLFLGVSAFLMSQYLFGLFLARIFQYKELFLSIHALKFSYLKVISFLMLPFLLFQNYGTYGDKNSVGLIGAVFLAMLLLIRVVLIVSKNNKVIFERLFYFIVYLCALEIAPLLILYKVVVNK